ncbi:MAG: Beta-barrel assembly-enhancing protease [Myxococcota bacterium]|nr:Beta-barrel assembly-enhancing protease [Myxococcota bacterium]
MKIKCPGCSAEYNIDTNRISASGITIKCPKCLTSFMVMKDAQPGEPPPPPPPPPPPQASAPTMSQMNMPAPNMTASSLPSVNKAGGSFDFDFDFDAGNTAAGNAATASGMNTSPDSFTLDIPKGAAPLNIAGSDDATAVGMVPPVPPAGAPAAAPGSAERPVSMPGGASKRYQIRRRNGKVYGPFDLNTIREMLKKGELSGNEDASLNGSTWQPLALIPELAQAVAAAGGIQEEMAASSAKSGGLDMAALLDKVRDIPKKFLIIGGGIVVAAIAVPVVMSLIPDTPDEPPPAPVKTEKPFGLEEARTLYGRDEFAAYKTLTEKLKPAGVPEKALLLHARLFLARHFNEQDKDSLNSAEGLFNALKGEQQPDAFAVSALAHYLLFKGSLAEAEQFAAAAEKADSSLVEPALVMAETLAAAGKPNEADAAFKRALKAKPDSLAAGSRYASFLASQKRFEEAEKEYRRIVSASPRHITSVTALINVLAMNGKVEDAVKLSGELLSKSKELSLREANDIRLALYKVLRRTNDNEGALKVLEEAAQADPRDVRILNSLGKTYMSLRRYQEASNQFTRAATLKGDDVTAQVGKVESAIELNKLDEASALVETALAKNPKDWRLYRARAALQSRWGKRSNAILDYEKAIELNPKAMRPRINLIELYLEVEDFEKAVAALNKAREISPDSPLVQVMQAEILLRGQGEGRIDAALAEVKKALKSNPYNTRGRYTLGRLLLEKQDYKNAHDAFITVEKLDPQFPGIERMKGESLIGLKEYDKAVEVLTASLKKTNPGKEEAVVYGLIARAYIEKGDIPTAEDLITKAVTLDKTNTENLYWQGVMYIRKKDYKSAAESLETAIQFNGKIAKYHFERGRAYEEMRDMPTALASFQKALQINDANAFYHEHYGDALVLVGKPAEIRLAAKSYLRVAELQPERVDIWVKLGDLARDASNAQESLDYYQRAYKMNSAWTDERKGNLNARIGAAYFTLEKYEESYDYLQRSLKLNPNIAEVYYHLGFIFKRRKDIANARKSFQNFLTLAPEDFRAPEAQEELRKLR